MFRLLFACVQSYIDYAKLVDFGTLQGKPKLAMLVKWHHSSSVARARYFVCYTLSTHDILRLYKEEKKDLFFLPATLVRYPTMATRADSACFVNKCRLLQDASTRTTFAYKKA